MTQASPIHHITKHVVKAYSDFIECELRTAIKHLGHDPEKMVELGYHIRETRSATLPTAASSELVSPDNEVLLSVHAAFEEGPHPPYRVVFSVDRPYLNRFRQVTPIRAPAV